MSGKRRGADDAKSKAKAPQDDVQAEADRIAEVIRELSKRAPAQAAPYIKQAAPHLALAAVYLMLALPYIARGCTAVHTFVAGLPEKVLYAGLGFAVCFFGGIFPATIAAAEAWHLCGGTEAIGYCRQLYQEFLKVQAAHQEDKKKDDNNDGVPDAAQLAPKDLILRKVSLAMAAVDPETVSKGVVGLYTGWIGVLAILKIKFAKTVTLGERIGEQVYLPASKLEPAIADVLPEEYRKWVPVAVRWTCKITAVSIAWWIQRAISAFHSAIRGGLLFGKYLVDFLHEKRILSVNAEKAYLDEVIGWAVAVVGLLFQFWLGFHVPFPLNLVTWPVQLLEGFIVWSVAAA